MSQAAPDPSSPVIVLVAEDEALVRMLAADILEDAGFSVIESRDATQAVGHLETRADVRALFTDIEMPPGMTGLELARQVRERWPGVAVLIASGKVRPAPNELPPGVRFIPKPYLSETVVRAIQEMVAT